MSNLLFGKEETVSFIREAIQQDKLQDKDFTDALFMMVLHDSEYLLNCKHVFDEDIRGDVFIKVIEKVKKLLVSYVENAHMYEEDQRHSYFAGIHHNSYCDVIRAKKKADERFHINVNKSMYVGYEEQDKNPGVKYADPFSEYNNAIETELSQELRELLYEKFDDYWFLDFGVDKLLAYLYNRYFIGLVDTTIDNSYYRESGHPKETSKHLEGMTLKEIRDELYDVMTGILGEDMLSIKFFDDLDVVLNMHDKFGKPMSNHMFSMTRENVSCYSTKIKKKLEAMRECGCKGYAA